MKINYFLILITLLNSYQRANAQSAASKNSGEGKSGPGYTTNWTVNPFDHQVFIENKGQFTADLQKGEKILYGAQLGDVYAFITNTGGIIYKYTERPEGETTATGKRHLKDPDDIDPSVKPIQHYLAATWTGSTNNVTTLASEEQTYYNTYPVGKHGTLKANIFKKVTCRNVYPGIDIEYVFPKGKSGVKYTLVLHPGADVSLVKLKYDGAKNMSVDAEGNVDIATGWGRFTDHAPVSHYQEDNSPNGSGFLLNNDEESFAVNNIDAAKTLVIDPWVTNWTDSVGSYILSNSGYDGAYDVDFDYAGNVYVYGGWNPFTLVKYNSAGVEQWDFSTSNFNFEYYGDFCVDKASGVSFCLEGFDNNGAFVDKVSSSGALLTADTASSSQDELWRASYDLCDHIILIAGGGSQPGTGTQASTLDTNFTTFTEANVMGVAGNSPYHDMALIATDPLLAVGYMATTQSSGNASVENNYIIQMPLPAMLPTAYNIPDNYNFQEVFSVNYVGPGSSFGSANGMNGMAVSPNWLYMYDGITLDQLVKSTGAFNASVTLPGSTSYDWGGLDVDLCNDIYVGNQNNVLLYNSSLTQTGTIGPFWGNVYDVVLGNGVLSALDSTLYVCGAGFLSSIKLSNTNSPTILKTRTLFCSCNCSATGTATFCGTPDTIGVTYLWSNGETTHTATGLCPGNTYTLTITLGCADQIQDTIIIPNSGTLTVTKSQTDVSCTGAGSATVNISAGSSPYTYSWSTGATSSSISGLTVGNYCATVSDNTGCQDSVCFIITGGALPTIAVTPSPDTLCPGTGVALTATGGVRYVWTPVSGLSCTTCSNPTASPGSTTTYTVTGTDVNGCSNVATATVVVNPAPAISISPIRDTVCIGGTVVLTAAGGVSYTWAPASGGLSCTSCTTVTVTPTSTTIYTVTGTDANGCTSTATATVFIALPPTISVSATKTSICVGTTVTLNASASNTTSPFTWQPGGYSGMGISVTPTITTTYTVTASSACGTATATITISVNDIPHTAFSADILSGCPPLCVQFRDHSTVATGAISQWGWSFGNGDTTNGRNPIFCYSSPGVYNVSLTTTTDSGCSSTLNESDLITVFSNPVANFAASPQPTTILQPTIQFTDESTDAYGIIFQTWNFGIGGDSGISNLQNPTHTYSDTGTYCVRLGVINQHGCVDSTTDCIVINPIFCLYIPNAFSPNGDGTNELFMAKGSDIKNFEMYIFNRWGLQLFHSTNIDEGWNGEVNNSGAISQQDAYVYLINVYDNKDKKHSYMGTVNLIK